MKEIEKEEEQATARKRETWIKGMKE